MTNIVYCRSTESIDLINFWIESSRIYLSILRNVDSFKSSSLGQCHRKTITFIKSLLNFQKFLDFEKKVKLNRNCLFADWNEFVKYSFDDHDPTGCERYSRYMSKRLELAEKFGQTMWNDFAKKLKKNFISSGVFVLVKELEARTGRYYNIIHHSTKMTPLKVPFKNFENRVSNLQGKSWKLKRKQLFIGLLEL